MSVENNPQKRYEKKITRSSFTLFFWSHKRSIDFEKPLIARTRERSLQYSYAKFFLIQTLRVGIVLP